MRVKLSRKDLMLNKRQYEISDLEDLIVIGEVHHTPRLDVKYDKLNKIHRERFRKFSLIDFELDIDFWKY